MHKMELLAPAGSMDKLKMALLYGADAVYLGGKSFGLRAFSDNFSLEEMKEAVSYAHSLGKHIYVTVNIFPHNADLQGLPAYLQSLAAIPVDAILIADPGIFSMARQLVPELPIHISTQANTTNWASVKFWHDNGAKRVVMAREVSLKDVQEIHDKVPVELEGFVHGAMCISYSGRCTLSNHMSDRDANRGGCSQSCRWKYDLYDMPFGQERKSIHGEVPEEYSMSAVDMCMIENIPDLIDNGVDSLKIEGRMKSVHYVSTVANCYKAACDAYMESAEAFYAIKDDLINELWKVAQRELATGFYYKTPTENEQLFGARRKIPQYKFVGEVVDFDPATMTATIRQRNVILEGDHVEFYGPGFRHFECQIQDLHDKDGVKCDIKDLHDANGNKIDRAPNPMELLTITVPQEVKLGDMIRSTKEGLINLYQKDGSSKTVRA